MTSVVEIYNKALANLNESSVINVDEDSEEATICRIHYDDCRRYVISEGNWGFCTDVAQLSVLSKDDVTGWDYVYIYPQVALKVINLFNADAIKINKFNDYYSNTHNNYIKDFETQNRGTNTVILSNLENAHAKIIVDVTNNNLMSPAFIDALTWRLTSLIAVPIIGVDRGRLVQRDAIQAYNSLLNVAWVKNIGENKKRRDNRSNLVKSRWG
ncbi:hypothetical protein BJAS_P3433 [Bathymodiolus japonicus methanotrophic gill symbiont]|uniref:hypothetical protein n=1 Tax=Bathymodiolus japonicus methanotrophic gill symbiont TaxID=113269 RepID=UPI001B60988C|nr:hypothetical protein [Bathymodiolus japonicus methanotrophic gill symbiont]GFO72897.1 hypothetical protein BJAS_P3433 [Bathymodiolus japonicus methanotrophic gill symbiont]